MPFDLLLDVIAYIKKTSKCPSCKAKYCNEDIFVLSTTACMETSICFGVFAVVCGECHFEGALLVEANENRPYEAATSFETSAISVNEVLDMHNFLKRWKGDVKELFQDKKV